MLTLELQIQDNTIPMTMQITSEHKLEFTLDTGRLADYEGSYYVIPTANYQYLATKDRTMTNDVTITSVPYAEVSNPSGGKTATIL